MSRGNKSAKKAEKIKGKAKKGAGQANGNPAWQAKGKSDQMKSDLPQGGERAGEASRD